jgi:hypothetical protein
VENKKLGMNEFCINKEVYRIYIKNECCSMLVDNFEEIDSLNQCKAIFDKMTKENSRK